MEADFLRIGPKSPLRPRGAPIPVWIRWSHKGREPGEGRRRELSGALRTSTVAPLWETHKTMFRQNALNKKPRRWTGFLEAFAVTSCKVDGDGRLIAECKTNLLDHPDSEQL